MWFGIIHFTGSTPSECVFFPQMSKSPTNKHKWLIRFFLLHGLKINFFDGYVFKWAMETVPKSVCRASFFLMKINILLIVICRSSALECLKSTAVIWSELWVPEWTLWLPDCSREYPETTWRPTESKLSFKRISWIFRNRPMCDSFWPLKVLQF